MNQHIDTYTRGRNNLDLMFSSDTNFMSYNLPLDNVIISDHTLCVIGTNTNISTNKPIDTKNIYSTNTCNHNLMDATNDV